MNWLDTLAGYAQQGVDAYSQIAGAKKPANNLPTPPATAQSTTPTWLMPALIGGGLLVLVLVLMGRSK